MSHATHQNLSSAIRAAFENGTRLLDDSQYLLEYGRFPTAYALSILAQEEYAKAFLLYLVQDGAVPWNSNLYFALRDHKSKQLLGTIMEHIDAEWEKYLKTMEVSGITAFPSKIADALNIIAHEKMPKGSREHASRWDGDDDFACDKEARTVADGKIDRQKQNSIYIGLGKTGQVTSTPFKVTKKEAETEFEKTKRFRGIFHPHGGKIEVFKTIEYSKISDAFKMLFGVITVQEYERR